MHLTSVFNGVATSQHGGTSQCKNTSGHSNWEVIVCILTEINLLKIVTIHDGDHYKGDDYLGAILPELYNRFNVPLTIETLSIDHEDKFYTYDERFSPEGEFFELRPKQAIISKQINPDDDYITAKLKRNNVERNFGMIVIVPKLAYLDVYLRGTARNPFKTPSGLYFIYILEELNVQDKLELKILDSILERLWRYYGILKAGITFRCGGNSFFYFNPFEKNFLKKDREGIKKHYNWGLTIHANLSSSPKYCNRTLANLYTSFNEYPLRYGHFSYFPSSLDKERFPKWFQDRRMSKVSNKYSKAYDGFEGIIFGNLMDKLNFSTIHRPDNSNLKFGYRDDEFVWKGSMGEVLYGRTTICANHYFIFKQRNGLDFLRPIDIKTICVATGKPSVVPQSLAMFRCFRPSTWLLLFVVEFAAYFCLVLIRYYHAKQLDANQVALILLRDTMRDLSNDNALNPIRFNRTSQRFLLAAITIFNLTISGIIDGHLSMFYTSTTYFKGLQTLDEVVNSPYPLVTNDLSTFKRIKTRKNPFPLSEGLRRKLVFANGTMEEQALRVAKEKNIFCFGSKTFFDMFEGIANIEQETSLLHVVPECLVTFHLAYLIRKDWALAARFNEVLSRLDAAGLIRYWNESSNFALIAAAQISRIKVETAHTDKALVLDDLKFAFMILGIGNFIAICVFCCERRSR